MISHLIVNYQAIKPKQKANDYLALRLLDALNGKRVDWNVAGLVARERHLAALLVALRDLLTIWGSQGILTNGSLAAEVPKVPHTIIETGDNICLPAAFSSEPESLILASKEEIGLVSGVDEISVVGSRNERWFSAVNPGTLRLRSREPVVRTAGAGIVDALPEASGGTTPQGFPHLVARQCHVLIEGDLQLVL